MNRAAILTFALIAGAAFSAASSDRVTGMATTYQSPNGVEERCIRIRPIPGGHYHKSDAEDEEAFCAIDLYSPSVALCPKTWSTSAGTMIYDISSGHYANARAEFERSACSEGKSAGDLAADTLAKFKQTMNASGTSGTFSTSSLLYYHFSRHFDATVKVPVAVWRSMDRKAHLEEVARRGLSITGHSHSSRMNHAAWELMVAADENPDRYSPTDELFTTDRKQIYGVLLTSPGHRYNSVINGTRKSGWGKGQNLDFQETPAFLALRSGAALEQGIKEGLEKGARDRQIRRDMGDVTPQQMVFWMREITEIVLLDYIFSQQDRIGNIDFRPYWYWVEDGKVRHKRAKHHAKEDAPAPGAILLMRTHLNDNDAGGRIPYANFAKSTQMLEKLRHFGAGTYRALMALDKDLSGGGPVLVWLQGSLGLTERQVEQVRKNTASAAAILRASCETGTLRFDLEPEEFILTGKVVPADVPCGG